MKGYWFGLVFLLVVVAWKSVIVNSAVIPNEDGPLDKRNSISQLKFVDVEQTMEDYVELAEAYYAPAPNDAVRERRQLNVVRNILNRTRTGFSQVRNLLRGSAGSGSGSSTSSSGVPSLWTHIRDHTRSILTQVITFFTRLWDRIQALFNPRGATGSSGTGPFARLRKSYNGLFLRLTGGSRTTTTESYPDKVYTPEKSSTTTTTEKAAENALSNFPLDSENDFPLHDPAQLETINYVEKVAAKSKPEAKDRFDSTVVEESALRYRDISDSSPGFNYPEISVRSFSRNPKA